MSSRRTFLHTSAALLASGFVAQLSVAQTAPAKAKSPPARPPALDPKKVMQVVGVSHGHLGKVRELVTADPLLVNACWDWGDGDFETPLQAAAHMGHRDIAEYLLSHNARFDIYAAAMLGQLDIVQTVLKADPITLAAVPGPHGYTLLHCAKQGGPHARLVYEWLLSEGVPEVTKRPLPSSQLKSSAPAS